MPLVVKLKAVDKIKRLLTPFLKGFFFDKRFGPILRVANNSQEKFTILHVPDIGLLCYLDSDEILL